MILTNKVCSSIYKKPKTKKHNQQSEHSSNFGAIFRNWLKPHKQKKTLTHVFKEDSTKTASNW